ncbi:efflux transporter outer membrane subunit [Pararobbsia silviterrae]|uniref:Efflux transporter outer membrane subunit n=1 Tax=Pararobbsia silviterrae TaxID=1792498 RepID=A0A494XQ09_9BURK|nr:efflux transporter outer membrane subunit [Pararobbsia silviterrae]RKP51791.1 efflux transporter outer membrane subunit [Pararobbsia silviterrae]
MTSRYLLPTPSLTRLALGALALSLGGCGLFGPDRNPPQIASPEHYSVEGQAAQLPAADGVAQRLDVGAQPVPQWWKAYRSDALNALIEEGFANSPSLAATQHTLNAAREGLRSEIGNSLFPSVDVGFAPSRQRALGIPILPSQETFLYNIFDAQVQASYTFDFFGAALLADRALAGQVQQQSLQFDAARRALAANIVVTTVNIASLNEQVHATEKLVELGEQRAQQTAARYTLGGASHDDALSAEQDAANAAATLPAMRAQWLAMRHAQAVLIGRTPDKAPEPLTLDELHLPDDVPVAVPSELLHQRPDILAAEAAVRAAADQAGAATAAMFPSLSLSASYGRGGFDWTTFTSPAGLVWSMGASLTQPLFHGGALVARKHQYEQSYEAAVAQYKQTVLSAFQTVANTLVSLDEDANTLTQTHRAMDAAQGMTRDTDAKYKLGATPFYATLSADQQYQSARVQYLRARAQRLADTATLFDSMGSPPVDDAGHSLRDTIKRDAPASVSERASAASAM